MADRRRQRVVAPPVVEEKLKEQEIATDSSIMKQLHKVNLGDTIQLNGTLFTVSSGQYVWEIVCPDGTNGNLANPTMPGPSFTATQEGDYVVTLHTDDGIAEITVHVE